MPAAEYLSFSAVCLYSLGALGLLAGTLGRRPRLRRAGEILSLCGFVAHSALLCLELPRQSFASPERAYLLQLLSWCLMAVVLPVRWLLNIPFLLLFSVPVTLVLLLFSLQMDGIGSPMPPVMGRPFFFMHVIALFGSLAFMSLGFGAALIFLPLQWRIKMRKPLSGYQKDLPALASLDKINAISILFGFPLFALGIISGFIWAAITWGHSLSGDPKEIFSLVVLAMYAIVFHQRLAVGWQGKKTAVMAIVIFLASLASLYANAIVPTHHSFALAF